MYNTFFELQPQQWSEQKGEIPLVCPNIWPYSMQILCTNSDSDIAELGHNT